MAKPKWTKLTKKTMPPMIESGVNEDGDRWMNSPPLLLKITFNKKWKEIITGGYECDLDGTNGQWSGSDGGLFNLQTKVTHWVLLSEVTALIKDK